MGCDGGTIPRRDELVRQKKKPETKDKSSHLIFQWRYCNLTQLPLQRPVVTCGLGNLYTKTVILKALIDRNSINGKKNPSLLPRHIKSMKDVKELNLTVNPTKEDTSPYICPITGLEMSGKFKFLALWTCGCVFSERALNAIRHHQERDTCPNCHKGEYSDSDVIVLNSQGSDRCRMLTNMAKRREKRKAKRPKLTTVV